MSKEKGFSINYEFTITNVLEIVGDWFKAKRIMYTDEMFEDYYKFVEEQCFANNSLEEIIKIQVRESIYKWLSVFHERKKETYDHIDKEKGEIVPEWFLRNRYKELEDMFSSKYFSYDFKKVETEYDSAFQAFVVTVNTDKEIGDIILRIISDDIETYLENRLTLLSFIEAKIVDENTAEFIFNMDW
jgi:hypothetical protein